MGRRHQLLLSDEFSTRLDHGGELARGKRKSARPIDTKRALHLVFRSSHARGAQSFIRHRARVTAILDGAKSRFGITVYRFSINSNHLHLVIRGRKRHLIQNFLRTFAGVLARAMTGARRAAAAGKFWDVPVWSRIVDWGRAFRVALSYVRKNTLEAAGNIAYRPRNVQSGFPNRGVT